MGTGTYVALAADRQVQAVGIAPVHVSQGRARPEQEREHVDVAAVGGDEQRRALERALEVQHGGVLLHDPTDRLPIARPHLPMDLTLAVDLLHLLLFPTTIGQDRWTARDGSQGSEH